MNWYFNPSHFCPSISHLSLQPQKYFLILTLKHHLPSQLWVLAAFSSSSSRENSTATTINSIPNPQGLGITIIQFILSLTAEDLPKMIEKLEKVEWYVKHPSNTIYI